MDHRNFDALTRSALAEGGTRRAVLRLLAGVTLGGLVARLGRSERAEATAKKRKQDKSGEKFHPTGALQAEGKRNKRRKNKPKEPKVPPPPPPPSCGTGERQCCSDERRCPDDSCVAHDACCFPDEMRCPDNSCVSVFACCPGEKACGDSCIARDACCDLDPHPLCDGCQQLVCQNGEYVCQDRWDGVDCGSGYCCPLEPPYFCAEVPGHGRRCCRPGYGGGTFVCI